MRKKIYGIVFGLSIFCMLGLLIAGAVSAKPDTLESSEESWNNVSSGSCAVSGGYGMVEAKLSVSWENSHGAIVAGAVGTWDENTYTGTIGKWAATTNSTQKSHEGFWQDHYWDVKKNYHLPENKVYIEEIGKTKKMYYQTTSYDQVHHHWVFDYKVKHTNVEWFSTHSRTYDDLNFIVISVHYNM